MTQINSSQIKDQAITASKISPLAVAWTAPTLQNNWINYGSGLEEAKYCKDALGFVHLRGLVKNGTVGQIVFTLPAGCRPRVWIIFPSFAINSTNGRIDIYSNGNIYLLNGANDFSLDGITFYAEN